MSFAVAAVVLAGSALVALALRARKRPLAVAIGAVAIPLVVLLGSVGPTLIAGYRQLDEGTIELQVLGARPIWRSVTQHSESPSTVTVGVTEIPALQLGAGFGDEAIGHVTIRLDQPLADRRVVDAHTGVAVPRIEAGAEPTPAASPSQPAIDVACTPDAAAPAYLRDPCPGATVAVEIAVAPIRLPIVRVVVEPGPFFCDDVWPGTGSAVPCYGPAVQPGQFMHAWVTFAGSTEVAAVMLGRDLPAQAGSPLPTPPPWTATLVKVEVPPEGWTLP